MSISNIHQTYQGIKFTFTSKFDLKHLSSFSHNNNIYDTLINDKKRLENIIHQFKENVNVLNSKNLDIQRRIDEITLNSTINKDKTKEMSIDIDNDNKCKGRLIEVFKEKKIDSSSIESISDVSEFDVFNGKSSRVLEEIKKNRMELLSSIQLKSKENEKYKDCFNRLHMNKDMNMNVIQNNTQINHRNTINISSNINNSNNLYDKLSNINLNNTGNIEVNNNNNNLSLEITNFKKTVNNIFLSNEDCLKFLNPYIHDSSLLEFSYRDYFIKKFNSDKISLTFVVNNKNFPVTFNFLQSPDEMITKVFSLLDIDGFPKFYDEYGSFINIESQDLKYIGCLNIRNNSMIVIKIS